MWKVPQIKGGSMERTDVQELKRRMRFPDFEDSFAYIQNKDFIGDNRKLIGTLDTLKNY